MAVVASWQRYEGFAVFFISVLCATFERDSVPLYITP